MNAEGLNEVKLHFRNATPDDLAFLVKLEQESFPDFQQTAKQNLKKGITSSFQEIIIVELPGRKKQPIGSAVLFKYKHIPIEYIRLEYWLSIGRQVQAMHY